MLNILILISFLFFAYKSFVELSLVMAIVAIPLWFFFLSYVPRTWFIVLAWIGRYIKSDDPDYRENCKSAIIQFSVYGIILTPMFIIFLRYFLPMMFG